INQAIEDVKQLRIDDGFTTKRWHKHRICLLPGDYLINGPIEVYNFIILEGPLEGWNSIYLDDSEGITYPEADWAMFEALPLQGQTTSYIQCSNINLYGYGVNDWETPSNFKGIVYSTLSGTNYVHFTNGYVGAPTGEDHGVLSASSNAGSMRITLKNTTLASDGDSSEPLIDFSNATAQGTLYVTNGSIFEAATFVNLGNVEHVLSFYGDIDIDVDTKFTGTSPNIQSKSSNILKTSGTATVISGDVLVNVTHDLPMAPDIENIIVTPTNSLGNAAKFWVSDVGATTFRINVNADPGATTATFTWRIE
ncbi:MAG: hypothetical protein Q8M92_04075, partial [Candidatus Subteraquimicrobiales bacterium]|nr:hypothetical protein [Candidatus Subteraquimicrobiales bacterium]